MRVSRQDLEHQIAGTIKIKDSLCLWCVTGIRPCCSPSSSGPEENTLDLASPSLPHLAADVPLPPQSGVPPVGLAAHVVEVSQLAITVTGALTRNLLTMIPRGKRWLGKEVTFMLSATSLQILSPSRPLAPPVGDHTELHFFPANIAPLNPWQWYIWPYRVSCTCCWWRSSRWWHWPDSRWVPAWERRSRPQWGSSATPPPPARPRRSRCSPCWTRSGYSTPPYSLTHTFCTPSRLSPDLTSKSKLESSQSLRVLQSINWVSQRSGHSF